MHLAASQLVTSATDVSGFLACSYLTILDLEAAHGGPKPPKFPDPGAEVLRQRGHQHESEILARYRDRGLDVAELEKPDWSEGRDGAWSAYWARTLEAMRQGKDVIYQACLFDGRFLGLPDFLVRVDRPSELGDWSYEVVDAKLARSAKVGAVLQICFYSEMLERDQGRTPERMHLALGGRPADGAGFEAANGRGAANGGGSPIGPAGGPANAAHPGIESFRYPDFAAYYRSVKERFLGLLADRPETYPEPCAHCTVCDWSPVCDQRWEADDHLSLVAGITRKQRTELEGRGVATLSELAGLPLPPETRLESVSDPAFETIREQARIQLEGRREGPKYELLLDGEPGTGLMTLPEPSRGDLFFDIEGDPHAFGDGLEYLLGYVDADGGFSGLWALDPEEERRQFERFIDDVMARLERWPELHIFHYAPYETSALKRLAARHATREDAVDRLLRGKVLVDLYRVVRQGIRASVRSYSIKKLEPLYGFGRDVELREASSALANFEAWLQLGGASHDGGDEAAALLRAIQGYNEDDCVSTLRLRDWLEERRSELEAVLQEQGTIVGSLPRPEAPEADAGDAVQEESERVQALMDRLTEGCPADPAERSHEEQAKWILAHLLSWHRREKKSMWWEYFRLVELDDDELLHDSKGLAGLEYEGEVGTVKRSIIHRYRFPAQDFAIRRKDKPRDPRTEKSAGEVVAVDAEACTIDLKRGKSNDAPHPTALIAFDDVPDQILRTRLQALADDVVVHDLDGATNRAAMDLLLRRPPRAGQAEGEALLRPDETNLEAARRIALTLDETVLPIQGPPGSGKTYIGARMIVSLLAAGKRVGVTATSHKVIVNLLDEVCQVADDEGVTFRGVQKASENNLCRHHAIERGSNEAVETRVADGDVDLVAGTVWLFSRDAMQDKLDVLFVDEAGQMSLANVLAASGCTASVVLLGDPQQLEQPQQGVHPPGTEVAALEHLVGAQTLRPELGLFLHETWRLHPDICAFTSELYYQDRLRSREELGVQSVGAPPPFDGAGLRFHPVEHEANSNESPEEVAAVARLVDELLDADPTWVDQHGERKALGAEDILVVAPYNAQVNALREALPGEIRVGTVDKFQGQEAPIVLYSTATSSVADAPRGMEFLFSPNRLNVATSRARCVVVVVGSPELLGPDCRSVRQMKLANGLCRFGEMAGNREVLVQSLK